MACHPVLEEVAHPTQRKAKAGVSRVQPRHHRQHRDKIWAAPGTKISPDEELWETPAVAEYENEPGLTINNSKPQLPNFVGN